ncbi:MAG: hypothetical protein KDA96_03380, partial [Planctomycetaceae bacterium]|nr:hypothetical protein [Planctomycetaceae bacterium]
MTATHIELEGVRVHNLRSVNVRIRRNALTVICGVSGSGKSSLAFDTLFAEGQRRYIETFSSSARQFLDRIERPAADRIDGIPPAIAIRQNQRRAGNRSTVGTRTEVLDYLRMLLVRLGTVVCPDCSIPVKAQSVDTALNELMDSARDCRAIVLFPYSVPREMTATDLLATDLLARGFGRILCDGQTIRVEDLSSDPIAEQKIDVVVDRVRFRDADRNRIAESMETAFREGHGECLILVDSSNDDADAAQRIVDGRPFREHVLFNRLQCSCCRRQFPPASVELLNFNSPLGACRSCEGQGSVSSMTLDHVVPDPELTLRDGAVRPWTTPVGRHEQEQLLKHAAALEIPLDVPFAELTHDQRQRLSVGDAKSGFTGLNGFYERLLANRHKPTFRAVLNRWRSRQPCPACAGMRLNQDALAVQLNGMHVGDFCRREIDVLQQCIQELHDGIPVAERAALRTVFEHLQKRIGFLVESGLG